MQAKLSLDSRAWVIMDICHIIDWFRFILHVHVNAILLSIKKTKHAKWIKFDLYFDVYVMNKRNQYLIYECHYLFSITCYEKITWHRIPAWHHLEIISNLNIH